MSTPVRVEEIRYEAERVYSLLLRGLDGPLPEWTAGSHVDLVLPTGVVRQYSLIESAPDLAWYRIAVLRENNSRGGSEYVHYFLRPGQTVAINPPRNHFTLPESGSLTLVAGGIGITPILAMLGAAQRRGRPWTLYYAGRSRSSMAFLDRLRGYGDAVRIWPSDERGRLSLDELVAGVPDGGHIVCCGPDPLLSGLGDAIEDARRSGIAYHTERFQPRLKPDFVDRDLVVHAARSRRSVPIPVGTSVLDGLLRAGVAVSSSCRSGVCGTCEVAVLDGTPEHRDDVLTADQQNAADRMLVCVSRAVGEELTLDV